MSTYSFANAVIGEARNLKKYHGRNKVRGLNEIEQILMASGYFDPHKVLDFMVAFKALVDESNPLYAKKKDE